MAYSDVSNVKVLDSKIFYYENVIKNPDQLIEIIEHLDTILDESDILTKWETWSSSNSEYIFGKRKYFRNTGSTSKPGLSRVYEEIKDAVQTATYDYAKTLKISPGLLCPISISKYDINKHMGPHADSGPNAHISAVLYLNDSYDEGGIDFPYQRVSIKPKAGSIVVFPSVEPYIHDPRPNLNDTKYIASAFWLKD